MSHLSAGSGGGVPAIGCGLGLPDPVLPIHPAERSTANITIYIIN